MNRGHWNSNLMSVTGALLGELLTAMKRNGLLSVALLLVAAIMPPINPPPVAAQMGTEVGGFISENTTWTVSDSPYIATSSILVSENVTLTIEPGVSIKFASNLGLQIDGELVAQGTEENPIIFTSNQTSPTAGDWAYIGFSDASSDAIYDGGDDYLSGSIIEYCIVEYAGSSLSGAIRIINSSPLISYCTIRNNANGGIYSQHGNYLHITHNTINSNNGSGISLSSSDDASITHNTVNSNNGSGISLDSSDDASIDHNLVRGNDSNYRGGGIWVDWSYRVSIVGNIIVDNSARRGGGIYLYGNYLEINGNVIAANHAEYEGGGIWFYRYRTSATMNSLIGNKAPHGAAIYGSSFYEEVAFTSNTIIGNEATNGGAVELPAGISFSDNNLWDNGGYNFYITSEAGATLDVSDNYWGTSDETEIAESIYDFFDNAAKGVVNYLPYLPEPDTSAPPSPPTGLGATTSLASETASINLTWSVNPESDITGYKIYYDTDSGFAYNGTGANEGDSPVDADNLTSFSLTGLSPGETYYLALTACDAGGDESWYCEEIEIYAGLLQADFSASPTQTVPGATIQFANLSQGGVPPYTYEWDFDGDSEIDSTEESPSHTYNSTGYYTVSLTVTDTESNSDTRVKENYITIAEDVIGLHTCLLAVMPDSHFYTPADLSYDDIGYPSPAVLERDMLAVALDTYGGRYYLESIPPNELFEELQDGHIDAALVTEHPWDALVADGFDTEVRFLPWSTAAIEAVKEEFPRVYDTQLPANTYPWQTEPVRGYAYMPLEIYVDDNFEDDPANHKWNSINEGLDDASDGDIIIVFNGTYQEHVTLDKSVTLETHEGATIDGGGTLSTVTITADGCTVNGFNITGSGSHPRENAGVRIDSDYNTISDNVISGNKEDGIFLRGEGNTIRSNLISGNKGNGLYSSSYWAYENTIEGNTISGNSDYGVYLYGMDNTLRGNIMSGNGRNFGVSYSRYNNDVDTSNTVDGKPIYYLIGEQDELIDSHSNAGYIIAIESENITIKDLTFTNNDRGVCLYGCQNCLIDNVTAQDNDYGMWLERCSDSTVQNCTVSGNEEYGLWLEDSDGNVLRSNHIEDNDRGIVLYDGDANLIIGNTIQANNGNGISLDDAYDNVIENNELLDNYYTAIALWRSDGNLITGNTVRGNNRSGITLDYSYDCTIEHNLIAHNERTGVEIDEGCGHIIYGNTILENDDGIRMYDTEDNDIHHNNFIDNADSAWSEEPANYWDDTCEGNYWSDYEERYPDAEEVDGTGIWDTPYEIPGAAGDRDNYPLMTPCGSGNNTPPDMPSNPSPANNATEVSLYANLGWTGGDPDVWDTVTYDVYFGTNATPPLVSDSQTGTTYEPGKLACNTTYYWQIVARDIYGEATAGPLWSFATQLFAASYNITLEAGWNLISLPLIPANPSIESVLAGVSSPPASVMQVWAWNGQTQSYLGYIPGVGGNLTTMEDGLGYWLSADGTATLTVNGVWVPDPPAPPPSYTVYPGWNLIGFKSVVTQTTDDYLQTIDGLYSSLWGYGSDYILVYPSPPGTGLMNPGSGYWLCMNETGTIVPSIGGLQTVTVTDVANREMSIGVPSGWTSDAARKAPYDAYYETVMVAGYTLSGACLMCYSSPAKDAYIFVVNVDSPLPLTVDRVIGGSPVEMYEERFPGYVAVGEPEELDKMTAVLTFTCDDGNGKQYIEVNAAPPQVWNINIIYEAGALDESTIDDIFASFTVL